MRDRLAGECDGADQQIPELRLHGPAVADHPDSPDQVARLVDRKGKLISQFHFAIHERARREGIEFPFPQRDLHHKSGALEVRQALPRPAD
jgi:hypothetical protein